MGGVTAEQKLRLVKQIRSRYSEDQVDMSNRERVLYGHSSRPMDGLAVPNENGDELTEGAFFFRVRLLMAVMLFVVVVIMDSNGMKVAGITAERIFQAISADYEDVLEQWVGDLENQSPTIP